MDFEVTVRNAGMSSFASNGAFLHYKNAVGPEKGVKLMSAREGKLSIGCKEAFVEYEREEVFV